MWATLALKLITSVFGVGQEYLEHRQKVEDLKQEGELDTIKAKNQIAVKNATADVDIDKSSTDQMQYSWKDEYWTIILSAPLILGLIPVGPVQRMVASYFQVMDLAPDWYKISVGVSIGASFGFRHIINYFGKSKEN